MEDRTKLAGAVHGMSGSPLYIKGKIAGAPSLLIRARDEATNTRTPTATPR